MNEVEKMYKLANIAKPVIKKWYYDGYYEDFSWQSSEEDCTKLLKHFDNSVDKLNDRIQQMKKEENTKYDRYTDSVDTEFGRIEKAYINYPPLTAEKQLNIIKWLLKSYDIGFSKLGERIDTSLDGVNCVSGLGSGDTFEESLAQAINYLWQNLTVDEQNEIRKILK